jgi:putative hydrolase of HD superfamily
MTAARTEAVIEFLRMADRLKHVERRGKTVGPDGTDRHENSADKPDLGHVLAMIAVHDLVEIEAGDTFAYDEAHLLTQAERERAAADVVFGKLPPDLGGKLRALWEEFEAGETKEARFAMARDRAQGFLQGVICTGHWKSEGVREDQTHKRMMPARQVAPVFETLIATLHDKARAGGMFAEPAP